MDELAQARATFLTECRELLDEMESSLLQLEKDPDGPDTINSLFRSAHTIKGSAGIMEMCWVEKFTHVVENVLDRVRDGQIAMTGDIIELLLDSKDHISALVDLTEEDTEDMPDETAAIDASLVERLNQYLSEDASGGGEVPGGACESDAKAEPTGAAAKSVESDCYHISLRFGPDVLRCGMDPATFINYLTNMGEITSLTTMTEAIPPAAEMDPESCYLGFEVELKSEFKKEAIEEVFEFVREDCAIHILPPHSKIDSYMKLLDELPEDVTLIGEILQNGGALTKGELEEALALQQKEREGEEPHLIGDIMVEEGMVQRELVDAALEKQKKNKTLKEKQASTIRIDASKLDQLVNLVGELVISSANIHQHSQRVADAELFEAVGLMNRLVEDIRDNTMKIRMIPIGDTFAKFRRVVRDIGRDADKPMELEVSGGETELDKTVIEKISDPLMHLVRNAADHGIEPPSVREAGGKPVSGTIRLNAYHDAGTIVIEVADDGKGLDADKIHEKAVSRGLVPEGQKLPENELYKLIFEPGFSTADKVTKLSGRGVGMDVVKKNIDSLRGSIEVDSSGGEGTTVRIRLPLTLAIIDGFMIRLGESSYVIPLEMVLECVELPETEKAKDGETGYINLRGEALPYLRMREYFNAGGEPPKYENIVLVHHAGQKIGLVADELVGEVQTVIKSLGEVYKDVRGVSGATIMGDGEVSLILDIPRLIEDVATEGVKEAV